jgi:hypothetical protein
MKRYLVGFAAALVVCLTLIGVRSAVASFPGSSTINAPGGIETSTLPPPYPQAATDCTTKVQNSGGNTSCCNIDVCFEVTSVSGTGEGLASSPACTVAYVCADAGADSILTAQWSTVGGAGSYNVYKSVDAGTYGYIGSQPQGAFPLQFIDNANDSPGAAEPTVDKSGSVCTDTSNLGCCYETNSQTSQHCSLPLDNGITVSGWAGATPAGPTYCEFSKLVIASSTSAAHDAGFDRPFTVAPDAGSFCTITTGDGGALVLAAGAGFSISTTGLDLTTSANVSETLTCITCGY